MQLSNTLVLLWQVHPQPWGQDHLATDHCYTVVQPRVPDVLQPGPPLLPSEWPHVVALGHPVYTCAVYVPTVRLVPKALEHNALAASS